MRVKQGRGDGSRRLVRQNKPDFLFFRLDPMIAIRRRQLIKEYDGDHRGNDDKHKDNTGKHTTSANRTE